MKIRKFLSVIGAVSLLTSSITINVNANTEFEDIPFEYRIIEGKAIVTNVETDETSFTLPSFIKESDGTVYEIIGIDDFAFSLCENLEVINVPESLTKVNTGNAAFLTSSSIMNFMDKELGSTASTEEILKYIALKANYKNGNFTDADLADISVKLNNKLSLVDVSQVNTIEGKMTIFLRNIDQMNLNPNLYNSLKIWISSITYDGLTLCGDEGTEIQEYALGREFLGLIFKSNSENYILGDSNGDGKFNVRDAAFIASSIANGNVIDPLELPAADYNKDQTVNVRDAATMARDLSSVK